MILLNDDKYRGTTLKKKFLFAYGLTRLFKKIIYTMCVSENSLKIQYFSESLVRVNHSYFFMLLQFLKKQLVLFG